MSRLRLVGDLPDLGLGAVKHGHDQPGLGGLDRAGQRIGAARVHDAGQHRLERPAALDQPFEPMLRHLALLPRRRRQNFQHRGRDDLTGRVGALAIQHDDALIRPLLPHHEPRRHRRPNRQRALDLHRGRADRTTGPGKGGADQCGQHRGDDARSGLALARAREHVPFAEGGGPGSHVAGLQRALDRCGVAGGDLVECLVHDGLHGGTFRGMIVGRLRRRRDSRHRRRRCFR